jgi:phospholipase C
MSPIITESQTPLDDLSGKDQCGDQPSKVPHSDAGLLEEARCGMGPRLPFLVISPYSRVNFVDNQIIDQSSIDAFIEDNWKLPRIGNGSTDRIAGTINAMFNFTKPDMRLLILNPISGEPAKQYKATWAKYSGVSSGRALHDVSAKTVLVHSNLATITLHPDGTWWPEDLPKSLQGTGPISPNGD